MVGTLRHPSLLVHETFLRAKTTGYTRSYDSSFTLMVQTLRQTVTRAIELLKEMPKNPEKALLNVDV